MTTNWYEPIRTHKSLGSQSARPGSLAGLAAARKQNLAQFFTPDAVAALMWRIASPAMDAAIAATPGAQVALLDTSVGSGRLLQFADPDRHTLAGADVHAPSIDALTQVAEAAGFHVDFVTAGLETLKPKGFGCALLNPPFSIHLDAPTLTPLPGNSFGRYGEGSAAISHRYAVEQALEAADMVLAIVPRSAAAAWLQDPERHDRLRAVLTLPPGSFMEEGTDVAVDLVVFGAARPPVAPLVHTLSTLDEALPDLDLACVSTHAVRARPLNSATVSASRASITLPVTGERRVRVVHDGRRIGLRFACGLVEAKVRNALLRRPVNTPSDTHRYPKGVEFAGQGVFDRDLYLLQSDPLAALEATLNRIREAGGEPDVDPGLRAHLARAHARLQRESTPYRHVVRGTGAALTAGHRFQAKATKARLVNQNIWGSPMFVAGHVYPATYTGGGYEIVHPQNGDVLTLDEVGFLASFDFEGPRPASDEWVVVHEGRVAKFPQLAHAIAADIKREGIDRWLDRDYQVHDIIEMRMGRGGTLAWVMALGKSRGALALALLGGRHNLLVLEPHLIDEMRREFEKVGLPADVWQVIRTPEQCAQLRRINIISYNRLRMPVCEGAGRRTYASLLRRRIATLIADEGDILTNPHSQQSRAIAQISPRRRYLMTGTPVRNMPRDLLGVTTYTGGDGTALQPYGRHNAYAAPYLLNGMDHATPGATVFASNFCVFEWVTHTFEHSGLVSGAKREVPKCRNLDQLRVFAAPLLKRRVQEEPEVARYIQVPTPTKLITTVEWDRPHLGHYLEIADQFAEWYRQARKEATGRGTGLNLIALLARIGVVERAATNPQFETPGFGAYGPLTSKQRYLLDRIQTLAGEGRKIICYVTQPSMVNLLVSELDGRGVEAVPFHGQLPINQRVRDMDRRFRYGDAPAMVASLETCQSGYNIPQADYVLFGNRSWVARTESQALFRVLRGEQKNEVTAEYVHLAGSIDEYQAQVVAMKADTIDATIDFLTPELQEVEFRHIDSILDSFVADLAARHGFEKACEFREHLKHVA